MKTPTSMMMKIGAALLILTLLAACDDGGSGGSSSTAPAATGSTSSSTTGSGTNSSSTGSIGSTGTTTPVLPDAPGTAQMVGTWAAPRESTATSYINYSFSLHADGSVAYTTATDSKFTAVEQTSGTWVLAGLNLVLSSPVAAMNGAGEVKPLTRTWEDMQVEINGRTYRKQ